MLYCIYIVSGEGKDTSRAFFHILDIHIFESMKMNKKSECSCAWKNKDRIFVCNMEKYSTENAINLIDGDACKMVQKI